MNPINDFQHEIKNKILTIEDLQLDFIRVICEDTATVRPEFERAVSEVGGIAVVISTPEFSRDGCNTIGIPASTRLAIRISEKPALNREAMNHELTALDVAYIVATQLNCRDAQFHSMSQEADSAGETVTVTIHFDASIML